jgi:hypothetical protein
MINTRYKIQNTKYEVGQGLIEMVIAMAVILTGIIGALALTISNLSGVGEGGTRTVASNLAREGVEVVRNIRDANWLKNQAWDAGLKNGNDHTAIAIFNPAANKWSLNFSPENIDDAEARLYRDDGVYVQDVITPSGTPTIYFRLLSLDEICENDVSLAEVIKTSEDSCLVGETKVGIRIKSEIKWTESGRTHTLTAEDRIYDWR